MRQSILIFLFLSLSFSLSLVGITAGLGSLVGLAMSTPPDFMETSTTFGLAVVVGYVCVDGDGSYVCYVKFMFFFPFSLSLSLSLSLSGTKSCGA